tara:strand:+ start:6266 stop:7429 length:1164 start_codon:yes stop_codon:yes gene_type:complete
MAWVLLIFLSAICISITAAYFSIVGLATMFPGSSEAVIVMGSVLEVGKLVAAVWLHKNWRSAFKFIRNYLLLAVVILSVITSMGIFGFLSRSHVEHGASMEKEVAMIAQLDSKISRENNFIDRTNTSIDKLNSQQTSSSGSKDEVISRLDIRIKEIKEEGSSNIKIEQDLITRYEEREGQLDKELSDSKETGLFATNKKYTQLLSNQKKERASLLQRKLESEAKIKSLRDDLLILVKETRSQIDSTSSQKESSGTLEMDTARYHTEIEGAYDRISALELEKFDYGADLRALEVEIGPIKYIANALQDWAGLDVDISEAIRLVIVTLIFVFDPLAILLLLAATMSYAQIKDEALPPDVRDIRNKLLDEMEEYLEEGGVAEHFIERCKK